MIWWLVVSIVVAILIVYCGTQYHKQRKIVFFHSYLDLGASVVCGIAFASMLVFGGYAEIAFAIFVITGIFLIYAAICNNGFLRGLFALIFIVAFAYLCLAFIVVAVALIALASNDKRKKYERKERYATRIRDRQEKAFAFASGVFAMLVGYAAEYVVANENVSLPKRAKLNPLKNETQDEESSDEDDEESKK